MRLRRITAGLVLGVLFSVAGSAAAEAATPVDTGGSSVVDQVHALSTAQVPQVTQAVDQVASDTSTRLTVVYVDTFSDPANDQAWALASAQRSGLGSGDLLIAVAVQSPALRLRPLQRLPAVPRGGAEPRRIRAGPRPASGAQWANAAVSFSKALDTRLQGPARVPGVLRIRIRSGAERLIVRRERRLRVPHPVPARRPRGRRADRRARAATPSRRRCRRGRRPVAGGAARRAPGRPEGARHAGRAGPHRARRRADDQRPGARLRRGGVRRGGREAVPRRPRDGEGEGQGGLRHPPAARRRDPGDAGPAAGDDAADHPAREGGRRGPRRPEGVLRLAAEAGGAAARGGAGRGRRPRPAGGAGGCR